MNVKDARKLDRIFDELGDMLDCSGTCREECVFPDVGTSPNGCPLNQFRDRVDEAMERRRL